MSSNSTDEKATESSSHTEAEGAAPVAQISEKVLHEISAEEEEEEEEAVVTTTMPTTMEDPPTILPIDPSPSPSIASGLQLPSSPARNDIDDDGGTSLGAWSEWNSIPDNVSKSSSSTRAKARSSSNNITTASGTSSGKRVINGTIYEDEGDLPSLSGGRRNCEPPDANISSSRQLQQQYRHQQRNDPPEYGYRKKVYNAAVASTGIHNIHMNSRGHVYLDGEDSVANSDSGPPGNRVMSNNNNHEDEDNETHSTTNSPPPPSDYFNQPSQRQMYPAEPRGGMVDIVSGRVEESSFVGSSEATSMASNTTRSSEAVNQSHGGGGGGGSGEYYNDPNSALNRHLSKSGNGTNGRSNGNGRKKLDPQDYTETIKKQDPSDGKAYSSRQASVHAHNYEVTERDEEMKPFIGRQQQQQQRVVYASSARRDLYNHNRNGYQDKAKDSDLESGRASHQQNQQRVRFAEKMFSSRGNASSSSSSSHQVVVGNAQSSSSSGSAYGLSWRDRSVSSDSSVISKSSIDSQSSNSSFSSRNRGSSNDSSTGGVGRKVVSLIRNGLWNIFEGFHPIPSAPASNISTSSSISSRSGSGGGEGGGTSSDKRARFQYLKRNTAILVMLSMMMLATIGSYYEAFFGVPNSDYNDDSTRGLGVEHDMRPPAMGLMDNVPHQAMLKGSVGTGMNSDGAGTNIMGGGSGALPPLVENGQVVDWDKVPPHLRGYYSKVFGVQAGANAGQQQQAIMQNSQQAQVQPDDPNAAGQAIQSIGNEAIGAVDSFKIPTLEQHEFQEHIQEIEGAIPFLGQQQQERMQQEQEEQMQEQQQQEQEQQEQLMQQQDEQVAKEELARQELEQVHLRQQAEAEQQRAQAEVEHQQQEQQEQEQQSKDMNAAHEEIMEREEEERRKLAEEEALRTTGIAEEETQQENMNEETIAQQGNESKAAAKEGSALDEVNSEAGNGNVDAAAESAAAAEGGQPEAEVDNNAALESLQSELSELVDMVKRRNSDKG